MALYTGTLPTRLLNDQQIRPGSWPTWGHVRREFDRHSEDRKTLAELAASIRKAGQREPVDLEVDDDGFGVRLADGHHRALVLMDLGIAEFTFTWCEVGFWSVKKQRKPFPYHLLGL
ncbi:ParB N-terminal domain-containing protein [Streptomyces sp. NPDC126503]|uniref:ParB N-terminal domain-containing protein n=1 Tax=Streptomyces sp. NPDC126503 TaxID=3155315 RepID=UPI00332A17E3